MIWFERLCEDESIARLTALAVQGGAASARGGIGSSSTMVAAALRRRLDRPLLLVTAHLDETDEAADELESLGIAAVKFPAMELLPGESAVALDLLAERLTLVRRLADGDVPPVIVTPIAALMQQVPRPRALERQLRVILPGSSLDVHGFASWLDDAGYLRVENIESPGEFSIRGGIIDIYPPGRAPSRIDLFGDEVEALFEIDLDTMGSDRRLERLDVAGASVDQLQSEEGQASFLECMPSETIAVLHELIEIVEQARGYYERAVNTAGIEPPNATLRAIRNHCHAVIDINQFSAGAAEERSVSLPVESLPGFSETTSEAVAELAGLAAETPTVVACQNAGEAQRMRELLDEFAPGAPVEIDTRYVHRGFTWGPELTLVPCHELLHRYQTRRRVRRISTGRAIDAFVDLEPGEYVVHREHGIAKFIGLRLLEGQEFLTLEFSRGAKLHVPATDMRVIQKYIGAFQGRPHLSVLGGKAWSKQKEKVADAVRDLAAQMLRIQAAREASPGIRYPADTAWQKEFDAEFPYEETDDQLACIAAVKRDMSDPRPMDRLICGDVGFGKTEIAIRAAFKAAEYGRQVAVLVPTTLLAEQHERTFRERFAAYPFRVESLSRFKTRQQQTEILRDLRAGRVDVVIGTHRILSKDVRFGDLGIVIVDEEQRFGVEHKQRLLELRTQADVLTLSATPIPRTLHMSMMGLRDISSLSTPPLDRRAVVTEVLQHDKGRIRQAIQRELAREGQVFYVHNRVFDIQTVADDVQALVPDARVIVGHGQMPDRELERVMLRFLRREADILVSTTIIESGIDIPTANTMFIDDADTYGLADLHQLRGRVGRYKHRAYCYLLLPRDRTVNQNAVKRLRAIEEFSMLGAGFKIALRDLEIRGAGNLLGAEQSGHIAAVGYEMYCELLERAVDDLKQRPGRPAVHATLDLGFTGSLPKGYIPSDARRMDAYRRISEAADFDALERVHHDLASAYGDLPRSAATLMELAEVRVGATLLDIDSISRRDRDIIFRTRRPQDLDDRMRSAQGSLRVVGQPSAAGLTEVYFRPPARYLEPETMLAVLRRRLGSAAPVEAPAARVSAG